MLNKIKSSRRSVQNEGTEMGYAYGEGKRVLQTSTNKSKQTNKQKKQLQNKINDTV